MNKIYMAYSKEIDRRRLSLADYALNSSAAIVEHLSYVEQFLHGKFNLSDLLKHAEILNNGYSPQKDYNLCEIVSKFKPAELYDISQYIRKVFEYSAKTGDFEQVKRFAGLLLKFKPLPESSIVPPDSPFYEGRPGRTLADARREV